MPFIVVNSARPGPLMCSTSTFIFLSWKAKAMRQSASNSSVHFLRRVLKVDRSFFISCKRKQKCAASSQQNEGGRNPEFVAFGQINEWAVNTASAAGLLRCLHHLKSVWLRAKKSEVMSLGEGGKKTFFFLLTTTCLKSTNERFALLKVCASVSAAGLEVPPCGCGARPRIPSS